MKLNKVLVICPTGGCTVVPFHAWLVSPDRVAPEAPIVYTGGRPRTIAEQFQEVRRCMHQAQVKGTAIVRVLIVSNLGFEAEHLRDALEEEQCHHMPIDCFKTTRRDTRHGQGWIQAYVWRYFEQ
jgi:hypothetical protein